MTTTTKNTREQTQLQEIMEAMATDEHLVLIMIDEHRQEMEIYMARRFHTITTTGAEVTIHQDGGTIFLNDEPTTIASVDTLAQVVALITPDGTEHLVPAGAYWHAWHGPGEEPDVVENGLLEAQIAKQQQDLAEEAALLDKSPAIRLRDALPCATKECAQQTRTALITEHVWRTGAYTILPMCMACLADRHKEVLTETMTYQVRMEG